MRALALLAALLVLATPFAASQSDPGPSPSGSSSSSASHSPSPTARPVPDNQTGNQTDDQGDDSDDADGDAGDHDDVECPQDRAPATLAEKRACFCARNPDADGCEREGDADGAAGAWRRWCRDEARADAQRERCRRALDEFRSDTGEAARVTFQVDPENRTIYDYRIDGRLVFEAILLDTGSDNLTVQRFGATLRIGDIDTELVLHEDPTGLVRFKGSDGSLTARLADGALVQRDSAGETARITFPDGGLGHLRAGNATWLDDSTVLVSDFLAFLLPPRAEAASDGDSDGDSGDEGGGGRDARVVRAIEQRKVGAEIEVTGPASAQASAADAGDGTVRVLAFDDVDVQVNVPSDVATPEAPIRVRVSAELEEGRTIVIKLDRSVLESSAPDTLVLRYFDIYGQADGSEVETEVVFAQAAGLADVLDPGDDGGQPEYWVVEDADGLQALVSVPYWSVHVITVGSLAEALAQPSVFIGILVGGAGSIVAAAAMLWPRRGEDDLE